MNFSILITTKDRPKKMINCLLSILNQNTETKFEVVVVDQSKSSELNKQIKILKKNKQFDKKIKYFKVNFLGRSKGLNYVYNKSKHDYVVVTDDDCIVTPNWIETIKIIFKNNPNVVGVIGSVFPYKPHENYKKYCPCIFLNKKEKIISRPCYHKFNLGFGSNFALKKSVLKGQIFLKEWLGPGSVGMAADDAELPLRLLMQGFLLYYSPKVKVFHDNWLEEAELRKRELIYSCGEVACYSYFWFQGNKFAKKIVVNSFKKITVQFRDSFKLLYSFKKSGLRLLFISFQKVIYFLRGFLVGIFYSFKDPIAKKIA